tara:strand:+ start:2088 stop:3905 length:1818 start_codon:yes stop_codon:yes gene_type:complete
MCGFIGYISRASDKRNLIYQKKFNFFFKKQKYRGPDYNQKILINVNKVQICLGFNRLSIQDRSTSGNKIFKNNRFMLLFNGEILNFLELKKKYFDNDSFESKTDTELLFKFLIKFNSSKINELEGMFAFALVDLETENIILCRDYTGIKPLFYLKNKDGIFFSSDAWFLYSLTDKSLDPYACKFFFQFGFTPKETSLIQNVKKVLPGHILNFNFDKLELSNEKYFHIKMNKKYKKFNNKTLENELNEIVKKNLISDTKVGIFLSGGVDSTILAILSKKFNKDVEAYSSYFSPKDKFSKFNIDYKYAEKICKQFDIKLNKVEINEKDKNQKKILFRAIKNLDEPISNLNFFNSYLQSENAKKDDCKVILTGDGADEIFGGYERYQKCYIAENLKFFNFIFPKLKRINRIKNCDIPKYFYNHIDLKNNSKLFDENFLDKMRNSNDLTFDYPNSNKKSEIINYFDISNWLVEESNSKLDKSSMLNSIEARVPFQDKNLIEKYFDINLDKKIDFFNVKKLLKKLKFLPDYIIKRKKHGWFSPESIFLRSYLKDYFEKTFEKEKIVYQKIFNHETLYKMFEKHNQGSYYKKELITIFTFQIWYDQIIDLD